jgi:hypothetical protein
MFLKSDIYIIIAGAGQKQAIIFKSPPLTVFDRHLVKRPPSP